MFRGGNKEGERRNMGEERTVAWKFLADQQVSSLVLLLISTVCLISVLNPVFSSEVLSVGVNSTGVCSSLRVRPCQVSCWGSRSVLAILHTPLCVCTSNTSGAAALCQHQRDWCLWSDCLSPAPCKDPPYHIFVYIPHCWSSVLLLLRSHWCCLCNCSMCRWSSVQRLCVGLCTCLQGIQGHSCYWEQGAVSASPLSSRIP